MSARSRLAILARVARLVLLLAVVAIAISHRAELAAAGRRLADLSPIALLAIPTFAVWNHLASIGWQRLLATLCGGCSLPSIWRLSAIRLEGQSLNLLLPGSGDALRAGLVARSTKAPVRSSAAVLADALASTTAAALFSLVFIGIGVGRFGAALGSLVHLAIAVLIIASLLGALWLLIWVFGNRGAETGELAILARQPRRELAAAYLKSVFWHLLEKTATAVEIYLALRALGADATALEVLFITAMMTGASILFFFLPAQVGAADAAIVAAFAAVGLPPTLGLSVALVRRARQVLVLAAGTAALVVFEGGR